MTQIKQAYTKTWTTIIN